MNRKPKPFKKHLLLFAFLSLFSVTMQAQTYTITASASPANGGTVAGGGTYTYNQSCTLTATPNETEGYHFVNWTKNGTQVSSTATYEFTVTESADYVAHFSLNSYAITVSANPAAGGTVAGGGNYTHGQSCKVIVCAVWITS